MVKGFASQMRVPTTPHHNGQLTQILLKPVVKNCLGFEILSYSQTNKVVCCRFMDVCRRHKLPWLEKTHSNNSSQNTSMFHNSYLSPDSHGMTQEGPCNSCPPGGLRYKRGTLSLGNPSLKMDNKHSWFLSHREI